VQEEKRNAIEAAQREKEAKKKAKDAYYKSREKTKARMTSRTKKGQPKFSSQIGVYLDKLKSGK